MTRPASEAQVIAWWRRWPDANVGVVTGRVSGLAVLDIDPRNGGDRSLSELEARWGALPESVEVTTGGGGRHLWFVFTGPLPMTILAPGVELKGEGGLVVVPPSLHASGARYAWAPGRSPSDRPLESLPPWLRLPGELHRRHVGPAEPPPPRTEAERTDFAEAWRRAGLAIAPGDGYYRCPFHPDAHPSLHIDADGCRWFCFGCRRGGGVGRLRELLGERPPTSRRRRLRAEVGHPDPVTIVGSTRVDVVGESYHQDELLALAGRRPYGGVELRAVAELIPEPDHPVDPLAVSVRIGGRSIGYLGREDARTLHGLVVTTRRSRGRATCRAIIRGGWDRGRADVGRFGVVLLLPAPDRLNGDPGRERAGGRQLALIG
jgi:hypothetical protein